MALVVDPNTGRLVDEKELGKTKEQRDNKEDININLYDGKDETDIQLATAEDNNEVSGATAFVAGLGSGVIKTVEGVVSLGAELMDLGATDDAAARVEAFFDKINPLEEIAEQRAIGKISEALVQVAIPGGAGAKAALATSLAIKGLRAKKAGKLVSFKNKNIAKGKKKAEELNKLSGTERFGAVVLGGAAGETLVADVEKIGNISDLFGPDAALALNRDVEDDPSEDAARKLMNRAKFGAESIFLTPFVYGTGVAAKALAKRGKELAYSSSAIARGLDKFASAFRFRGRKPQEVAEAKKTQKAREMRDTNFAEEQVARIDKQVDKVFPEFRKFFNASAVEERKQFLTLLDDALFKGDLNKVKLDPTLEKQIKEKIIKRLGKKEGSQVAFEISKALVKTRGEFGNLLNVTAGGPGAKVDLPAGVAVDLRKIMGNRVKNYIGNTFEIFENAEAGFLQKYKPARQDVDRAIQLFMRYAAKNKNPITELEAEGMVNDIIKQVRKMDPKRDRLPTFAYQNLSRSADDAFGLKTFAQTIEKKLPGGKREIQVIGKGSKIFRDLFGEINDVRHSIFEGMNRLSVVARKNQLFDEILDADEIAKANVKADTPFGQRGFFHPTPLAAKRAFGNEPEIVKMDDYVKEYFKDGVLVNRLSNTYTTREIAESFTNVSKIQDFMRGEIGGAPGKTFSWAWRNLLLTPKAGAQYAKTILSVPTHIRNFLSSSAFSFANGTMFTDPRVFKRAMDNAFGTVQVGGPRKEFMQDLYVAEDDFWKVINYEVQLVQRGDRYAKAGIKISPQALKQEVAQIVQDTVPNYAKVGEFVRAARVSPFGNFMSWPSEVFRNGYGIFKQIAKDLRDPVTGKLNPVTSTNPMKDLGLKRLVGMVGAMGIIPYGLTKGSQAIFGVSNEEADAANDFVAPWAKSSQKIYFRDPNTDELFYIDWSKNNVYDTLTRPFQTVLRNIQEGIQDEEILLKGFVQGIAEAAGETASPFISESIYTEAFMDIWGRNGRTREGKQLYNDQTPGPEKIAIIMQHLGKTLLPTTQPFQRTKKAFTGEPGKGSELYEIPYELAGIFGFRGIKVNPEKSMAFKLFEYQKAISDSRKLFTGEIDVTEMRTANDVINRYYTANKKIFENRKKLLNTVENAEIVGLPPFKTREIFEKRGLESVYDEIINGTFDPFFPSERLQEVFAENARKGNVPNVFFEAEPTLRAMEAVMNTLTLFDDFDLKLKDFLPDEDPQGQSALPLMPMPNIQPTAQQINPITNLTRTEQALLSPEEQVIASRT